MKKVEMLKLQKKSQKEQEEEAAKAFLEYKKIKEA